MDKKIVYFVMDSGYCYNIYAITENKDHAVNLWRKYFIKYTKGSICIAEYYMLESGEVEFNNKYYNLISENNKFDYLLPLTDTDKEIIEKRNKILESYKKCI
jgi:hypothetical protein